MLDWTDKGHPVMHVDFGGNSPPPVVCAQSWCTGACGYPALVAVDGRKAHGQMVAFGPVLQPFRVEWTGAVIRLTEAQTAELEKSWWL